MKRFKFSEQIIFENEDYIAINKPAGVSSLHERIGRANSVIEQAKQYDEKLQLCHRLDKDTSGALLISKHHDAYVHAAKLFEKRRITKVYHAVSDGAHSFDNTEINLPLTTTRSGRSSISHQKGKKSKTIINTLENFGKYTLLACSPESGRLHQIRIHLASQGAAIAADEIYGGEIPYLSKLKRGFSPNKQDEEKPMITRFALHAYSLNFEGMAGEEVMIEAPYPKDFGVFVKLLRKYDQSPR